MYANFAAGYPPCRSEKYDCSDCSVPLPYHIGVFALKETFADPPYKHRRHVRRHRVESHRKSWNSADSIFLSWLVYTFAPLMFMLITLWSHEFFFGRKAPAGAYRKLRQARGQWRPARQRGERNPDCSGRYRRRGNGTRIHNGIIGRPRSYGGQAPDRARP